jgi:hypothetical protein
MRTIRATQVTTPDREEPTLEAELRSLAHGCLAGRLYQCLELAMPLAVQLAVWGWWRSAGWSLVVSAFGAWGLCDQALERHAEQLSDRVTPRGARWLRAGRAVAGLAAGVTASALLMEAFGQLMGSMLRCLGCAG